jgi:hypothetical protein
MASSFRNLSTLSLVRRTIGVFLLYTLMDLDVFNLRNDDHCCSQVDEVQIEDSGIMIPLITSHTGFCHPHCRMDKDNLERPDQ